MENILVRLSSRHVVFTQNPEISEYSWSSHSGKRQIIPIGSCIFVNRGCVTELSIRTVTLNLKVIHIFGSST